jgi:hypothetical protein
MKIVRSSSAWRPTFRTRSPSTTRSPAAFGLTALTPLDGGLLPTTVTGNLPCSGLGAERAKMQIAADPREGIKRERRGARETVSGWRRGLEAADVAVRPPVKPPAEITGRRTGSGTELRSTIHGTEPAGRQRSLASGGRFLMAGRVDPEHPPSSRAGCFWCADVDQRVCIQDHQVGDLPGLTVPRSFSSPASGPH